MTEQAARGLTEGEAARRLSAREPYVPTTSRSSIVRANVYAVGSSTDGPSAVPPMRARPPGGTLAV